MQSVIYHSRNKCPGTQLVSAVGALTVFAICYRFSMPDGPGLRVARNSIGDSSGWQIPDEVLQRSTPQFAFQEDGRNPALVFCTVETGDFQHHPAIFIHDPGGWRFFDIPDETFSQSTWIYVGTTRDRRFIWSVIDVDVESPGWDLEITFSHDAGKSWTHIGTVHKPNYLALLDSFQIATTGKGWLTVHLDDACFSRGRGNKIVAKGYYTYYTSNGGRHWSAPRYSRVRLRTSHQVLITPSYSAVPGSISGIHQMKALMARMEGRGIK
jgi:hypothetical protein